MAGPLPCINPPSPLRLPPFFHRPFHHATSRYRQLEDARFEAIGGGTPDGFAREIA